MSKIITFLKKYFVDDEEELKYVVLAGIIWLLVFIWMYSYTDYLL